MFFVNVDGKCKYKTLKLEFSRMGSKK
jgi:hypothetical protein